MKNQPLKAIIFLFFGLFITHIKATQIYTTSELNPHIFIGNGVEYFEDKTATRDLYSVYKEPFLLNQKGSLNFGLSKSVYWVKFKIKNETREDRLILKIAYPLIDSIDMYLMKDGYPVYHKGDGFMYNLLRSDVQYPVFLFYLPIAKDDTTEILLRVKNHSSYQIPIEIATESELITAGGEISLLQGMYYGILIVMILYNLFIFFSLREIVYVYYAICIFFTLCFFVIFHGHAKYAFWPDNIYWNQHSNKVVMGLLCASSATFALVFLELKSFAKWLFYVMRGIVYAGLLLAVINFFIDLHLVIYFLTFLLMFNAFAMLVAGLVSWYNGYRAARLFVLAWTSYLIGAILLIFRNVGWLPANVVTSNFANIGSALEVILLSLALADKYSLLKAEKEKAQDALLVVQKNQNAMLENKVKERTLELQIETEKTESLLLNILPEPVAHELKNSGKYTAKRHDKVSVMFTDFVNFTHISEQMIPEMLVFELDTYFKKFDEIITKYGIEKIKTIGDAYLCVSGLHEDEQHAQNMCKAALEILSYMNEINAAKKEGEYKFELRIGIHSGNVVAGVVGSKKFAYDIWGDTVNIAARMEQHGVANRINISHSTCDLVKNEFQVIPRGSLPAKNLGEVEMFFLEPK